jgi:outer membrane protein TolC
MAPASADEGSSAAGDAIDLLAPGVESASHTDGLAVAGAAQDDEHPVYHLMPEPFEDGGTLEVNMANILELAVAGNLGLMQQEYTIEKGHYAVDKTYYAFDPALSGSLTYSKRNQGSASATAGGGVSSSESMANRVSLVMPRDYGDSFQISFDTSRASYGITGGSSGEEFDIPTTYGAGFSLSYSRPLARGAGRYYNLIPRYIASNNLQLSYDRLDDEIRRLKKEILDTYFAATAARETIAVREASLDVALQELERTVERYKVGVAIRADLLQAENSVLTQRSQLLEARRAYDDLRDTLAGQLGLPREITLSVETESVLLDLGAQLPADLWQLVQDNSYELKNLNTQLANLRLQRDQQLSQLKPDINLGLNYGRSGEDDTLGSALGGYENESYGLQINWSATPGERSARADLASTQLDLASLDLAIRDTELQLQTALRQQQRNLSSKYKQIELAQSNLDVVTETHNIQLERNRVGLATTLDVVEAQEAVLAAELALLNARVAFHQAYREILLLAGLI